jgi:hypothetical protein
MRSYEDMDFEDAIAKGWRGHYNERELIRSALRRERFRALISCHVMSMPHKIPL